MTRTEKVLYRQEMIAQLAKRWETLAQMESGQIQEDSEEQKDMEKGKKTEDKIKYNDTPSYSFGVINVGTQLKEDLQEITTQVPTSEKFDVKIIDVMLEMIEATKAKKVREDQYLTKVQLKRLYSELGTRGLSKLFETTNVSLSFEGRRYLNSINYKIP